VVLLIQYSNRINPKSTLSLIAYGVKFIIGYSVLVIGNLSLSRDYKEDTKLIPNAFRLYFIIGHSVFDIGYSSLKLIAMGVAPG
jgi:hypothetical protein